MASTGMQAASILGAGWARRLPWAWLLLPAGLMGLLYYDGLAYMVHKWIADENYGHGFFVPLISGYLIWQSRSQLRAMELRGSWWGVPVVAAGLGLYLLGTLATLYVLVHLSFWIVLMGLLLAFIGPRGVGAIAFPLCYLLTVIPLPDFLQQGLSTRLQLISSQFGVGFLQLAGVMAYREGNVIDLGPIQLQVVEACSGLRYLFPLAWLALLCAYLFQDRMWKRAVLFLSSVPIAIFLNSFRIGVTGLLVDRYGRWVAEGFFHNFSGWLLFVSALAFMVGEMWLLSRIGNGGDRRSLGDRLWRHAPAPVPAARPAPRASTLCAVGLLVPTLLASAHLARPDEAPPSRRPFVDFPMAVGGWSGKSSSMEQEYIDSLRFDDYLLADYRADGVFPVNLYVAYYNSQKAGRSAHSPRTCIPGGGWEITSMRTMRIDSPGPGGAMTVNRAIIQKGDQKELVFYWFQQRGRFLTNEYLVKWYLLWDALTMNRTDGALVRLITGVVPTEGEAAAERRLVSFTNTVRPMLTNYIPGDGKGRGRS